LLNVLAWSGEVYAPISMGATTGSAGYLYTQRSLQAAGGTSLEEDNKDFTPGIPGQVDDGPEQTDGEGGIKEEPTVGRR
jgi:hypothetical protein